MSFKLVSFFTFIFAVLLYLITYMYKPSYSRFCIKFLLPWQPGSLLLKFDWHHLIACPVEPPVRRTRLGDIYYTRRVIGDFVLNFVAMATGLVMAKFVWRHSIAQPRIPPLEASNIAIFFYTSGVIASFVSNFVVIATRVGCCKIWLTWFDSPNPKTPC